MEKLIDTSESAVLLSTCKWLNEEGWRIRSLSPATGKGLVRLDQQVNQIGTSLRRMGITHTVDYYTNGPDIAAMKGQALWKIECKGIHGPQTAQTQRTNFDRAVASAVSYFEGANTRVGIAIPSTLLFDRKLGRRLPHAMRRALDFWVISYSEQSGEVMPFGPDCDTLPPD